MAAAVIAVAAVGPVGAIAQSPAASPAVTQPVLGATAAILVNLQNGRVVYGKDPHVRLAPASLTKVVTALVVRDHYPLDEMVTVDGAVNTIRGEKLGLKPGMQLTVRDLLYGLLLLSGNDAAAALAAHDPLGVADFVVKMNDKARLLGAMDSTFTNPHGLDDPGHLSSVWDMALFARRLLADPVLADIVATKTYPVPWPDGAQRVIQNHNKMLWRYEGTVGVKTGFTNQAGKCLIAAAETDAGTALTVVLHSPDHYRETTSLFDYYKTRPPVTASAPVLATPRPSPRTVRAASAPITVAPVATGTTRYRWVAFPMGLLAVSMLLTLRLPRRRHVVHDAAQFHSYLEPLADE
jgi:D-alanyl-D-alanine carboxypeptidase